MGTPSLGAIVRRIAATGAARIDQIADAPDGRFASLGETSVIERAGGVYAAFGTRNGRRVIRLSSHFARFRDSASRLGFALDFDERLVGEQIRTMLDEAGFAEARLRISAHPDDMGLESPLVVAAEPFTGMNPDIKARGVRCATQPGSVRNEPRAKQTGWLAERAAFSSDMPDVYEYLLIDPSGAILEGTSSNFYAIVDSPKGPCLRTADAGILGGIARSIVLEVAIQAARVELSPIGPDEIPAIREAFLTSASRGVVPIVAIDDRELGEPGEVTGRISELYERRATALEESL